MTTSNRTVPEPMEYDADSFSGIGESPRAPIIVAAPAKKPDEVSPVKSSVIVHAGCIRQPSSAVSFGFYIKLDSLLFIFNLELVSWFCLKYLMIFCCKILKY